MNRFTRITLALMVAMSMMFFAAPQVSPARAGTMQTYVVLYKQEKAIANIANVVKKAGGTLVYTYGAIGVAIARSDTPSFRANLLKDSRIENASAVENFGVRLNDELTAVDANESAVTLGPTSSSEPLAGLQWDMAQIHIPEAHAITTGSQTVVVGDLDTGLDFTHPDIAPNYDASRSTDCSSGAPTPLLPGNDQNGHGTHTAGTIAAAANGIGISGVAPNVKIAGIKTSNDDGFFFPHMVICAFIWVGDHGIDVTNNSYFADPWLFNCRNDHEQHAIWKAEQRAIRYAMSKGVTVVASAGNENQDLAHPTIDEISPDFPPGAAVTREVTNACVRIPAEIPGVITVSANGNKLQKAYYSDYGIGVIQVVAPGGDRRFQITAAAPNGRVLSTWPAALAFPSPLIISDPVNSNAYYAYLQGTSMAGPHVAGVAALVISQFGKMPQGKVAAMVTQTADPIPCPPNPFNPGPPFIFEATCQGGNSHNSFYGSGQVNAFSAVTHNP